MKNVILLFFISLNIFSAEFAIEINEREADNELINKWGQGHKKIFVWLYKDFLTQEVSYLQRDNELVSMTDIDKLLHQKIKNNTKEFIAALALINTYIIFNYGLYKITPYLWDFLQPSVMPTAMIISMALISRYSMGLSSKAINFFFRLGSSKLSKTAHQEFSSIWKDSFTEMTENEIMGRNFISEACNYLSLRFLFVESDSEEEVNNHVANEIIMYKNLHPNINPNNKFIHNILKSFKDYKFPFLNSRCILSKIQEIKNLEEDEKKYYKHLLSAFN